MSLLPDINKVYPLNQTVDTFVKNTLLYPDQVPGVVSALPTNLSQIVMPTGMGKSMVANAICAILAEQTDEPCVFTFTSPTKILGAQLLVETMLVMAACGIKKVSYLTVNSDTVPVINRAARRFIESVTGMELTYERNTTSKELINDAIQRNKAAGYHTVISSTYHSMDRVLEACHIGGHVIDCHINDEPQKLVTDQFKTLSEERLAEELPEEATVEEVNMEEFSANIQRYATRVYSVTATPKHTYADDGIGMQNEKRFGPVVYELSEKECYQLGRKVPPKLARMKGLNFQITSPKSMGAFVSKTYEQFAKRWDIAKVLYDTKGTNQIRWFIESGAKEELIAKGVNVAHCDSKNSYWINDEKFNDASAWKAQLNELDESMPLVCLHVEMLVEGLDVPGFNSLMMMKTRGQSALKQLIGRVQRLIDNDRKRMGYGTNFTALDLMNKEIASGFEKAFALVAVNEYDKDIEAYLKTLVNLMRKEYGFTAEQLNEFSDYDGTKEDDPNGDGTEGDGKPARKVKEIIDYENFQADLSDIDELYNDGKLSKIEYLKRKALSAINLTKAA
jgi:superfamily II DNA or RNA helicase